MSSKEEVASDNRMRQALIKIASKALLSKVIKSLPNIADTMAIGGVKSQTLWDNVTTLIGENIDEYNFS